MDKMKKAKIEVLRNLKQDFMSPGKLSEGTEKYTDMLRSYGDSTSDPTMKNNLLKEAADRDAAEVLLKSDYNKMEDAALRMGDEFDDMVEFHKGPYGSPSHLDELLNGPKVKKGLKLLKGGAAKALPFIGPAIGAGLAVYSDDAQAALGDLLGSDAVGEGSDEPVYSPEEVRRAAIRRKKEQTSKYADGGVVKDRMACNKPRRDSKGEKTHVVKACQDGKEKIVRFGHKMPDGTNNPKRRKSYCARSAGIGKLKDKLSANYWSRKAWKC